MASGGSAARIIAVPTRERGATQHVKDVVGGTVTLSPTATCWSNGTTGRLSRDRAGRRSDLMSEGFVPTSLMHRKAHAPEHMVRIFDVGDVHVVCRDCGMHDWGDFGNDENAYTVEAFRAKYGDRVLEVVTLDDGVVELWTCQKCGDEQGYLEENLTALRPDGTRGHLKGPFIDGDPIGECAGPVDGPVKGY